MSKSVNVPQLAWQGVKNLELTFPENWQLTVNEMEGHDRPALLDAQIRAAIRFPISTPPSGIKPKAKNR
jgi:hypothetical protein